jgi:hypothetical protein
MINRFDLPERRITDGLSRWSRFPPQSKSIFSHLPDPKASAFFIVSDLL